MLFHGVEDCFAVVRNKGVYRQVRVFARGEHLFAGVGSGFVRLLNGGSTTVPTMTWDFITPHPDIAGEQSRTVFMPGGRKPLTIVAAE